MARELLMRGDRAQADNDAVAPSRLGAPGLTAMARLDHTAPPVKRGALFRDMALDRRDIVAICAIVVLTLAALGPHILGLSTFLGNADRLHTYLNMRELAVDARQQVGRMTAWNETMHLGIPLYGLHCSCWRSIPSMRSCRSSQPVRSSA